MILDEREERADELHTKDPFEDLEVSDQDSQQVKGGRIVSPPGGPVPIPYPNTSGSD